VLAGASSDQLFFLNNHNFVPKMMMNTLAIFLFVLSLEIGALAETIGCLTTTSELSLKESMVKDLTVTREYILCGNTIYNIGFLDSFGTVLSGGYDMIQLRPNLHLKCGATGSRENKCLVASGDIQLDGTSLSGVPSNNVDNVVITGLTFLDASQHTVWINKPGNVLFRDCEFRVRWLVLIVLLVTYKTKRFTLLLKTIFSSSPRKTSKPSPLYYLITLILPLPGS
jgi:hypothetical protein